MSSNPIKKEDSLIVAESEATIEELEAAFPAMADIAFAKAYQEALAAGFSVLQSEDGIIYEVFPDGRRVERMHIEPPTYVPVGTKATLR